MLVVLMSSIGFGQSVEACDQNEEIEYPIPDDFIAPEHCYTDAEIESINALAAEKEEPTRQIIDSSLLDGGGSTLTSLSSSQMNTVFTSCLTNGSKTRISINGIDCIAFSTSTNTVYVPLSFLRQSSSGTCMISEINSTMTSRANNQNASPFYGHVFKSYMFTDPEGYTVYRFNITKLSFVTGQYSIAEWLNKITVSDTIGFDAYPNFVSCSGYTTEVLKVKPTVTFKITNTGSSNNSLYFGGYYFIGIGENTSSLDISEKVSIAYGAYELFSSQPTQLTALSTLKAVYGLSSMLLTKTTQNSRKKYTYSGTQLLSSPGDNVYAYTCKNASVYYIKKDSDYFELKTGMIGSVLSSTRFSLTYTLSITQ